jgi:peptide/nickel transport system permease protein
MTTYLIRRLLLMVPTLIGSTLVVFFVIAMSPGGLGASLLNKNMDLKPAQRKAYETYLNQRYGLNKPLPLQYLKWLSRVLPIGRKAVSEGFPTGWTFGFKTPDLGKSFTRDRPVADLIGEALPITLLLEALSLPIIYGVAFSTGIRAALSRGKLWDVGLGTVLIALFSLPEIWVGVLLIGYLTSNQYVHWFPSNGLHDVLSDSMTFLPTWGPAGFQRGWLLDTVWHLVLPLWVWSYGGFAFLSRLMRGSLLETLGLDYVRTARAKGLSNRVVLYRHVVRNSLISQITSAAGILPGLIAGSVIIETIFGIPGMGKLAIDAVNSRDKELFLSITLIASLLQLLSYLITDIAYAIADPRVSYVD